MSRPLLVLDFDGVIHLYTSSWQGARVIPDPPVPGALEFIVMALDHFELAIFSSRSHHFGGRRAMKRWLKSQLIVAAPSWSSTPPWWQGYIARTAFADPWADEVALAANRVVREIRWPLFKPPAFLTIDDRAMRFEGTFPNREGITKLKEFRPWHKKEPA